MNHEYISLLVVKNISPVWSLFFHIFFDVSLPPPDALVSFTVKKWKSDVANRLNLEIKHTAHTILS